MASDKFRREYVWIKYLVIASFVSLGLFPDAFNESQIAGYYDNRRT